MVLQPAKKELHSASDVDVRLSEHSIGRHLELDQMHFF